MVAALSVFFLALIRLPGSTWSCPPHPSKFALGVSFPVMCWGKYLRTNRLVQIGKQLVGNESVCIKMRAIFL